MRKNRLVSIIIALTFLLAFVAGCSGNQPATNSTSPEGLASGAPSASAPAASAPATGTDGGSAPGEKIQLTLGNWPEESLTDEIAMHEGFVKKFNEMHPDVEVVPAYYEYAPDTFISRAEAGTLPVLFQTWFTEPAKLISSGFVRDITPQLEARGWLDKIDPNIRELLSDKDGKIYGLPREGYALSLMANLEILEEAGYKNDDGTYQYPKNWEELAEMGKVIKEKTGAAGLCLLAKNEQGGWHFSSIAWDYGAEMVKDNGDGTYTANLNSPEVIEAMEYVKSLKWEHDILTADPMEEDWGTGFSQIGTGGAAFYMAAPDAVDQPTYNYGLDKDSLALFPLPAGPKGQFSLFGGTPYMFSKDATDEQVEAALDYLMIMGKAPENNDIWREGIETDMKYRNEVGIPVVPRFMVWSDKELEDAENAIIEQYSNVDMALYNDYYEVTKMEGNIHAEEPGKTQDMYMELTKVIQACVTDKNADVKALLDTANSNYQAILDAD